MSAVAADARLYSMFAPLFRDTTLRPALLAKYRPGVVFVEPTFCDASSLFGGLAAPHRYLLFANSARELGALSLHPEWGLCILPRDRRFKVLGVQHRGERAQVVLLEVPPRLENALRHGGLSWFERRLLKDAERMFDRAAALPPLAAHCDPAWLDRLRLPLGIDDAGRFFAACDLNDAGRMLDAELLP